MTQQVEPPEVGGKREAILDAALDLFLERGFHGTPVPMVADRAGVGAGTIYRYFESKDALVNAVFQKWKATLGEQLIRAVSVDAPLREQFRAYAGALGRFALAHPRALAFLELHHHAPYLDATSRAMEEALMGVARTFVARGQAERVLKDVAPELLYAIVEGAFIGIVKAHHQGTLALTPELLDTAARCLWEAIER